MPLSPRLEPEPEVCWMLPRLLAEGPQSQVQLLNGQHFSCTWLEDVPELERRERAWLADDAHEAPATN